MQGSVITLTTDFGLKDHYIAVLKGFFLTELNQPLLIDISHQINKFDVAEAAYLLKNVYSEFPAKTIHLVGVGSSQSNRFLIIEYQTHFFVLGDVGFLGLLFDKEQIGNCKVYAIKTNTKQTIFPERNILAPAVVELIKNNFQVLAHTAEEINNYKIQMSFEALVTEQYIKGIVVHVDDYGNVFTNIHQNLFEQVRNNRPFKLFIRGFEYEIDIIHKNYNEVAPSEIVAIFTRNGWLQIAINMGNASNLLGLHKHNSLKIEFYDK